MASWKNRLESGAIGLRRLPVGLVGQGQCEGKRAGDLCAVTLSLSPSGHVPVRTVDETTQALPCGRGYRMNLCRALRVAAFRQ